MKKLFILTFGVIAFLAMASCRQESHYSVIFNTHGGSAVEAQVVVEGGYAIRPANPTRTGYVFADWYHDSATTRVFNFTKDAITSQTTIHAGWTLAESASLPALKTLITETEALSQADYTATPWTNLQTALGVAKLAATTSGVTDTQVANAVKTLQDARSALVYIGGLNSLIQGAGSANRADYSSTGWTALQNALNAARTVQSDPNATTDQVTQAASDLQTAVNNKGADTVAVDKSGLQAAITAVKALPEGAYTVDSWAALRTALTSAEATNADSAATQQQVTDALTALGNAAKNLAPNTATGGQTTVADKGALGTSIAGAESKVEAEYTTETWSTMQASLTEAKKVQSDPAASQAQVDAAKARLDRDVAALQHKTTSGTTPTGADKGSLNSFIADSEKLVQANYTADSWSLFQTALTNAKTVAADTAATQTQVDTAYADLERAVNNLALQQTNTGVVSGLVNQLSTLLNSLPTAEALQVPIVGPLLAEAAKPVATLADGVRDQLIPLVGDTNAEVNSLGNQLNGILNALNLGSLI